MDAEGGCHARCIRCPLIAQLTRPLKTRPLSAAEWRFWLGIVALLALGRGLWSAFGPALLATLPAEGTARLVAGLLQILSLGTISDISPFPQQAELGWLFQLPAFSQGVDGAVYQPVVPFFLAAPLLFPLLSFALCQGLSGGVGWRPWLLGLVGGVLWFGLGLVAYALHLQCIAAMQTASPFIAEMMPPPHTLRAPAGLTLLFYGSGWLVKVLYTLEAVAGFALWAGLRGAANVNNA